MNESIDVPYKCPQIILEVGPCRSGTTAHVRLFAQAGIPAYHQPIKTLFQQQRQGNTQIRFSIPDVTQSPVIFIKETIGAYTAQDSTINPLHILISAGVPPKNLQFISVMREPLATMTAWKQMTSQTTFPPAPDNETLLQNFISAYKTVKIITEEARVLGIPTISLIQELLRDHDAETVVHAMFTRLRLPYTPDCFSGWRNLPGIDDPQSHITMLHARHAQTLHQKLEQSDGLMYYAKDERDIDALCSTSEVRTLVQSGVIHTYEYTRQRCIEDLGLTIAPSRELDQYWQRKIEGCNEEHIIGKKRKEW